MIRESVTILFWLLPLVMFLAGVALVFLGLRGRKVDNHPLCRRCGYDLIGNADSVRCPECGSDLNDRKAIVLGHRQRRRKPLVFGFVLATPALAALLAIGVVAGRGFDLDRHKPTWLLCREGDIRALTELNRRLGAGELDRNQVKSVVAYALREQANRKRAWNPAWGDFVESARTAQAVDEQQWKTYTRQAVDFKLEPRQRMRRGDPVLVDVTPAVDRTATRSQLIMSWRISAAFLGNVPLERSVPSENMTTSVFDGQMITRTQQFVGDASLTDLPDGPTPLRLHLAFIVRTGYDAANVVMHSIEQETSVVIVGRGKNAAAGDGDNTTTRAAP